MKTLTKNKVMKSKIAEQLVLKFRPRTAIKILSKQQPKELVFLQKHQLTRLLVWSLSDQFQQKRANKNLREGENPKRRIRTKRAVVAGHISMAKLLQTSMDARTISPEMSALFFLGGGFKPFIDELGGEQILRRVKEGSENAIQINRTIEAFISASSNETIPQSNRTLGVTRSALVESGRVANSESWQAKFWERNKSAAPYLYGFRSTIEKLKLCSSFEGVLDQIFSLADDRNELSACLSEASWVATFLKQQGIKNVRVNDLHGVKQIAPNVTPLSEEEINYMVRADIKTRDLF